MKEWLVNYYFDFEHQTLITSSSCINHPSLLFYFYALQLHLYWLNFGGKYPKY